MYCKCRSKAAPSGSLSPRPLEHKNGRPADPPVLHTAVPNWNVDETIPLSAERALRVVEIRSSTADENPVLVVEPA
jgi:hypothetical protein